MYLGVPLVVHAASSHSRGHRTARICCGGDPSRRRHGSALRADASATASMPECSYLLFVSHPLGGHSKNDDGRASTLPPSESRPAPLSTSNLGSMFARASHRLAIQPTWQAMVLTLTSLCVGAQPPFIAYRSPAPYRPVREGSEVVTRQMSGPRCRVATGAFISALGPPRRRAQLGFVSPSQFLRTRYGVKVEDPSP